ncbi:hypothetical protein [Bifidobacterium oedipodis]|uniref:Uncharacterized protein n=1 Tax=Bifidobacterium oedipodis TaxID=2675322 RepID=A0A7Y0EQ36_9BIFI|nr:hypothetical protein [Bifidobacterium sp. DSM 109957]NMM93943.1 hypothetical protein [Bifidobacterium sp. DSM 109957]
MSKHLVVDNFDIELCDESFDAEKAMQEGEPFQIKGKVDDYGEQTININPASIGWWMIAEKRQSAPRRIY